MHKINSLFLLLILVIISSCSSDSPNEQIENATIVGEWKLASRLDGANQVQLNECEQGGGVIFRENLEANFIVVDRVGIEPDIVQEGYENCDFRYASYDYKLSETKDLLYTIVEGEGLQRDIDDAITTYDIELLTAQDLRIRMIAHSSTGTFDDVETNSEEFEENEQVTLIYKKE